MMRVVVTGAFLLAALAGCLSEPDKAPGVAPPPPAAPSQPPVFGKSVTLRHDRYAGEPSVVAAPDGTLFVVALSGLVERPGLAGGAAWLWRSQDGGGTWETLRSPHLADGSLAGTPSLFYSNDADVAVSPDGWVYYCDWWMVPLLTAPGNFVVEASADGGDTWTVAPVTVVDPDTNVYYDRQWLVAGADGFVGLVYIVTKAVEGLARGDVYAAPAIKAVFSNDHGRTWGLPVDVVVAEEGTYDQISRPVVLPDGTLALALGHMTWADADDWTEPGEVRVALSRDAGASWEVHPVAPAPEGFDNQWAVQSAVDGTGTIHVAWAARNGTSLLPYHAESADGGVTWSAPEALRTEGVHALPWVAARGDGTVAVGWYGGNHTGDPTVAPADAEWFAYVAERETAGANWTVTRISDGPVKRGPLCVRAGSCPSDRELLDYVGLAYAPDGRLHAAFSRTGDLADSPLEVVVQYAGEEPDGAGTGTA